ncbi:MAG: hypothetical protein AAF202_03655 [Pseudomonadota bacterium]
MSVKAFPLMIILWALLTACSSHPKIEMSSERCSNQKRDPAKFGQGSKGCESQLVSWFGPNAKAKQVDAQLNELFSRSIGLDDNVSEWALLRVVGPSVQAFSIIGHVSWYYLTPEYRVLRITDPRGNVSFLDPEKVSILSVSASVSHINAATKADLAKVISNLSTVWIDGEKLKSYVCDSLNIDLKSRQFQDAKDLIRRNLANRSKFFADLSLNRCPMVGMIGGAVMAANGFSRALSPNGSFYADHSSNLVYSVIFPAILYNCLTSMSAMDRRALLALSFGGIMAGNIWEEIDIPGLAYQPSLPRFNSAFDDVKTDMDDFMWGSVGSLLFLTGVVLIENSHKFDFRNICK